MKAIGKSSIASFLKIVLDIGWWAAAIGLGLATLLLLLAPFAEFPGGSMRVPVFVELDADTHYARSPSLGVESGVIEDLRGYLSFPTRPGVFLYANLAIVVALLGLALWLLTQLRHVFRTLRDGRPFVPDNARRIRWIGYAVIAGEIARAGAFFFESYYTMTHFSGDGIRFGASLDISGVAILHGLVILVIAEIFRLGTRLEEDQSLTV